MAVLSPRRLIWLGVAFAARSRAVLGAAPQADASHPAVPPGCRAVPGDAAWPAASVWDALNQTVGGRLVASLPRPSVCHDPTYDEAACEELRAVWGQPAQQIPYPAEFLQPWFLNQSCSPWTDRALPCELGNYAAYSINVLDAVKDIAAGFAFARENNIRLVVKNTGSDFMGRSTGKGALSLWTHNLDTMRFTAYNSSYYNGPALKVGAGVQSGTLARFAHDNGYRVVLGSCESVGYAGGFIQGGGHSQLSGLYGMAADQILEIDLVAPSGEFLTATPTKNTDLYWAIAGGGGGTYAVVTGMTVRVFPEAPVVYASFFISVANVGGDVDAYWSAVQAFHDELDSLTATGSEGESFHVDYSISDNTLFVLSLLAPNGTTEAQLTTILSPMMDALAAHNDALTPESMGYATKAMPTWYDEFQDTLGPVLRDASMVPVVGARFIPRPAGSSAEQARAVTSALRTMTQGGNFTIGCAAANVNHAACSGREVKSVSPNAVHQSWRTALASCFGYSAWDWQTMAATQWGTIQALQKQIEEVVQPALAAAMPTTGAYLNEANWNTPEWQETFFGPEDHYNRLLAVKRTHDPEGLLYGINTVGSEAWKEDGEGRLCRVMGSEDLNFTPVPSWL